MLTELPVPDFELNRFMDDDGTTSSGEYPTMDRWGRVTRHMWTDSTFANNTTDSDYPNIPPILQLEYAYDNASNRLHQVDGRPGASQSERDEEYTYDGLDRLTEAKRGEWNGTSIPSVDPGSRKWTLDMFRNKMAAHTKSAAFYGKRHSCCFCGDRPVKPPPMLNVR